ncbi:MAG: acyltransferase [Acutalibacteraceae bacterium]|nr:acyltransferase [Acutalibacteraceae bacterium]
MNFILYDPTMIFIITFFVITVFSLIGTRKNIGKINENEFFSINQTNWLRGVAISWIAFSHYYQDIGASFLCAYIGTFGVGVFFLCSGYGLTVSKLKKKDYHKGFLKNKLLRIYAPYVVAFIIKWLMVLLIPVECNDNIFLNFLTVSLPNAVIWYLKVQIIMYIVYYVMMLICKDSNKMFCGSIFLLSAVYMLIGYFTGIESYWYQNTLWFPIGILLATYKTEIFSFIQKYFIRIFILCLFFFAIGFGLVYLIGGNAIYELIMTNATVACILLLCTKLNGESKIMKLMGRYSLEIYFSHSIVATLAKAYFPLDNTILAFVFIIASVLVAIPIKFSANKIVAVVDKITNK